MHDLTRAGHIILRFALNSAELKQGSNNKRAVGNDPAETLVASSFREVQFPQTKLTSSAVRKKIDQEPIHCFWLFFCNGMPSSRDQMNALQPCAHRVHTLK